ncbi:hypothetical protein [Haliangium sp.]|uniref:hypothetical protein n=1 Tax=Haliangium sp. TaxID=2663208 RepID=UPI003D0F9AAB
MASEEIVDVTYRGLTVAAGVSLSGFGPQLAYLRCEAPVPVGTALIVVTDGGPTVDVRVARVREDPAEEGAVGMWLRAERLGEEAAAWWAERADGRDPEIPEPALTAAGEVVGPEETAQAQGDGDASEEDAETRAEAPAEGGEHEARAEAGGEGADSAAAGEGEGEAVEARGEDEEGEGEAAEARGEGEEGEGEAVEARGEDAEAQGEGAEGAAEQNAEGGDGASQPRRGTEVMSAVEIQAALETAAGSMEDEAAAATEAGEATGDAEAGEGAEAAGTESEGRAWNDRPKAESRTTTVMNAAELQGLVGDAGVDAPEVAPAEPSEESPSKPKGKRRRRGRRR